MRNHSRRIRRYSVAISVAWTACILCSFFWFYQLQKANTLDIARAQARVAFEKDTLYRKWATSHGGVYVPVTEQLVPSPYLAHIADRDITSTSGKRLTLMNPAWMTRQVFEMAGSDRNLVKGHITSLEPIRPENAADSWELTALQAFEQGTTEVSQVQKINGIEHMRVMRPFIVQEGCLKCHGAQGYRKGDVRGGISVMVPVDAIAGDTQRMVRGSAATHGTIWLLGIGMIAVGSRALGLSARELQQSEERYRTVADYTSDWEYWIAPDGSFEYLSPSCRDVSGYGREEFLTDPDLLNRLVHPDDREKYQAHLIHECDRDEITSLDFRIVTKSGEIRWVSHVCRQVLDSRGSDCGRRASNRDITERKLAEEALYEQALLLEQEIDEHQSAEESLHQQTVMLEQEIIERTQVEETLRQSEEKFFRAFQRAPLIFAISAIEDGRFMDVNDKFLETTGYGREEVIGRSSVELGLITAADRQTFHDFLAREGRVPGIGLTMRTRDGKDLQLTYFAETFAMNGTTRLISMAVDSTEHRRLEEQLRHSQKMEAIGQLAGGIAHDFNNKLTVILGYAELALLSAEGDAVLGQYLREIAKAGEHSRDITRQLLAFSRRQASQPRPLDLNALLGETRKTLSRLIGEDVLLTMEPGERLWTVNMDPSQVDQIIMNLALNARDAMPEGGQLSISTANVLVDTDFCHQHAEATPGEYVRFAFADTGVGIDRQTLEHIFEPFFTTKGAGRGTGLGLATVYGIVKQNGGFINVYSEPGHGSVFKIFIPRHTQGMIQQAREDEEAIRGSGTVLLVEDDDGVRSMVEAMLTRAGYRILVVPTPQAAIDICADPANKIDVVLSDVIMPMMSGREMVSRIKAIRPDVKVLYMSGYTTDLITQRGLLEDANNFVQKPFDMRSLHRKLVEVMQIVR